MAAEGDIDRLVLNRLFPGSRPERARILVEVGAARPDFLSVSALFRQSGWRVLSVEPNPYFAAEHRRRGHEIYEVAASDRDAEEVEFEIVDLAGLPYQDGRVTYESFSSLGITGPFERMLGDMDTPATRRRIKVATRRLDSLLTLARPIVSHVDVLCIDVEGWEMTVLDGLSPGPAMSSPLMPDVMIVENFFEDPAYRVRLDMLGYRLAQRLAPNELYVRRSRMPMARPA